MRTEKQHRLACRFAFAYIPVSDELTTRQTANRTEQTYRLLTGDDDNNAGRSAGVERVRRTDGRTDGDINSATPASYLCRPAAGHPITAACDGKLL